MPMTAAEQYMLELINRARLDPLAEAARYGSDLNQGLAPGTITASAKQVLAPNAALDQAAEAHSLWMLNTDTFSHTGAGGSTAGDRMAAAGYVFTGTWSWAENLHWYGTTGALNLEAVIGLQHQGLFESASHRVNTFAPQMREIGIAQVGGQFTSGGVTYNASMVTQNFALSGATVFVTGVAYTDRNADAFYGIGEGLGGITITAAGNASTTAAAGGYSVGVAAGSAVTVNVAQGATALASLTLDMAAGNGKLDVLSNGAGGWSLALSTSATLISGIANATLLGVANLNLTGSSAANTLGGNKGNNVINGKGGADHIAGGAGNDILIGGYGRDVLDAGVGADEFYYRSTFESTGRRGDQITNFEHGVDHINLAAIDSNPFVAGNQAFSFIGAAGFGGLGAASAGQLRLVNTAGHSVIQIDTDGNGVANMQILATTTAALTLGDFIL